MKRLTFVGLLLFSGCISIPDYSTDAFPNVTEFEQFLSTNKIDYAKLQKAIELSDRVVMNNYTLVATNDTMRLYAPISK